MAQPVGLIFAQVAQDGPGKPWPGVNEARVKLHEYGSGVKFGLDIGGCLHAAHTDDGHASLCVLHDVANDAVAQVA